MNNGSKHDNALAALAACKVSRITGEIIAVKEMYLETLLPGIENGSEVRILTKEGPISAEVISLNKTKVGLMPLSSTMGVKVGDPVEHVKGSNYILCGRGLIGRVIDSLGNPLDSKGELKDTLPWPVNRPAPIPLSRLDINKQLHTGIKVIDGCLAVGKGQRLMLNAEAGVGKSTLLGSLAADASSDVSVICLVGERGREVRAFLDDVLGPQGLRKSVIIVASADDPPIMRVRALVTATAVAEWFRAKGDDVLLLVDSLTRVVRAKRDVALALGDPPTPSGYPASAFSFLPSLIERAGRDNQGSITAVYAVLTEGANDDPVAKEVKSLTDGHIVLSEKLAHAGRWPAVDLVASISRVMPKIVNKEQLNMATHLRRLLSAHKENEDLILMGAYKKGTCRDTDSALQKMKEIEKFLRQSTDKSFTLLESKKALQNLVVNL